MQRAFEKIIERLEKETDCPNCSMYCADADMCGFDEMRKQAIEIVNQVASEVGGGWIPCSERMPENNRVVLCWVKSTTIASGETFIIGSCDRRFWFLQTYEIGHHHFPVKDYEVVAWCELPESYKVESEG